MVTERLRPPPPFRSRALPVARTLPRRRDRFHRWGVVGLAAAAVALFAVAYFLPWWRFTLFAPQYPRGLRLTVSLTGIGGDVREIDMLNHYIGMAHLEAAAPIERALAGWGVAAIGVATLAVALVVKKRGWWALFVPALVLCGGFLADSYYWLRRFGHHLDPRAPLHIPAFTPNLFGPGHIGQFRTVAVPDVGFGLAVAALSLLVVAALLRRRFDSDVPVRAKRP